MINVKRPEGPWTSRLSMSVVLLLKEPAMRIRQGFVALWLMTPFSAATAQGLPGS